MSALQAIHASRRQVHSLKEDETWRDFVEKHTGQRSTRGLTPKQSKALLAALDAMGAGKSSLRKSTISGPYAKKIQALWISCWNLGLIKTRDDTALNHFAIKQANVDHVSWIRRQDDAVAVIEALKKMLERRGVNWSHRPRSLSFTRAPGFKVAYAQYAIVKDQAPYAHMTFEQCTQSMVQKCLHDMTGDDWIEVMNTFGEVIRSLQSEGVL